MARTARAAAGGVARLAGGAIEDGFQQHQQAKADAERDSVLGSIATDQAREDRVFELLFATSEVRPVLSRPGRFGLAGEVAG